MTSPGPVEISGHSFAERRRLVARIDIFIDDGSHLADDMIFTMEEMLPNSSSTGVYMVEDVFGREGEWFWPRFRSLECREVFTGRALHVYPRALHVYPNS